jgi:hypothetical protein
MADCRSCRSPPGSSPEVGPQNDTRNTAGRITKLTFVTEPPEYYQTLWNTNSNLVLTLCQTLVSPAVTLADLHG